MFTQSTVTMHNYEPGFGKMAEWWASVPQEARWLRLFLDEQERLKSKEAALHKAQLLDDRGMTDEAEEIREAIEHPYLFQGLPPEVVDLLAPIDKDEMLVTLQRGWQKIAEPGTFRYSWDWLDLIDAERACAAALIVIDAKLNFMHSLTYQGPVRRQDMGCSQEAVTQAMLLFASENLLYLRKALTDEVAPKLSEAKLLLRSRLGQVDLTAEFSCVQCAQDFSGAKGFVLLDAPRRGGVGNGVYCLDCFGH